MSLITILFVGGIVLFVVGLIVALVTFRKPILASRPIRVGLAILVLPAILFCAYGFLASFEGSHGIFMAFRIGYVAVAVTLSAAAGLLTFGRLRRMETPPMA